MSGPGSVWEVVLGVLTPNRAVEAFQEVQELVLSRVTRIAPCNDMAKGLKAEHDVGSTLHRCLLHYYWSL